MKRSAALMSLSHDHHHALDVARRLRRATSSDFDAARAYLLEFWEPRGRRHFEVEERVLLGAFDDDEWQAAAGRIREEHDRIRQRIAGVGGPEDAHVLGELLHDHVRFEERRLFALLEARMTEDELTALGAALERAERECAQWFTGGRSDSASPGRPPEATKPVR